VKLLFCKAFLALLTFELLGLGRHFGRMHRFVANWKISSRTNRSNAIEDVCTAVNYACIAYPKRILCLQRSAVTTCLLRSLGVPAQMVMGAQKMPFKAHAWTEVDGRAINERRDVKTIYGVWERC
jgi:hypothetical protein